MKLFVDSAAREATLSYLNTAASPEKYNYIFHEDTRNVRKVKLASALVPRSFYAVKTGWSSRFEWDEAGTARAVSIPEGTYDGATLATVLSGLVSAVTAGFTVTYDEVTNKLTFVNATGGNIAIGSQVLGLFAGTYPEPGTSDVLGLGRVASGTIATANSYEAPEMVNMSIPAYLFLTVTSGAVNNSLGIRDWYTRRQFMISFGDTPYLGIKEQPINSQFCQCERIDNQVFKNVLVEWRTGIPDQEVSETGGTTTIQSYTLDFNGINHQLVFDVE